MASYLYTRNIDPKDSQPPQEPKQPMSRKEKWSNFWFYHKWHILITAVALVIVASFVHDLTSQVQPDYTIGVIASKPYSSGAFAPLEDALVPFGEDLNGDGQVVFRISEYDFSTEDPTTVMASSTRLMGDAQTGECLFYLVDDVPALEEKFGMFAYNDGTEPDYESGQPVDTEGMGVPWSSCPKLTALDLGNVTSALGDDLGPLQDLLSGYSLVRRIPPTPGKDEEVDAYFAVGSALFEELTEGSPAS